MAGNQAGYSKLGDKFWQGFTYQYRYESDEFPTYKILDRATWEIGGQACGNEFWLRHGGTPITRFESREHHFSTEWYLPGIANPNIFQFQPWQTQFQGFTFTASNEGLLATLATEVAHIRSLFEKPRDCDEIVHFHEHCADLNHKFATSLVEVLWLAGGFDTTEKFNHYEDVRAWLHPELHRQIGMREERVTTCGLIEEWGQADIDRYRCMGAPKLLEAGIKTVVLPNHFMNNMNVYGVSNMCCSIDYKFLPEIGAEIKKLGNDVNAAGARLEMWGNTAISTLTIIFDNPAPKGPNKPRIVPREDSIMEALDSADSPWVRNASGAFEADHYTPVFAQLNMRDKTVFEYWMKRWGEAKNEYGISSIFVDSSFNMSSDKFSYHYEARGAETGATIDQVQLLGYGRPAVEPRQGIESQYHAYNALMVAMQGIGYQVLGEDIGVFGISRSGPSVGIRLDNLALWQDCLTPFYVPTIEKAGYDTDEIFFRGLAYRQMWILYWDIARDCLSFDYNGLAVDDGTIPHVPTAWHIELFKTYNAAEIMRSTGARRHIFDEEKGVEYREGNARVVWAFDELTVEIGGAATITNLRDGAVSTVHDFVTMPKFGVYQVEETTS